MSQAGVTEEMREQIDVTRAEKRHAGGGRETREEGDVRRGSCGRRERWEEGDAEGGGHERRGRRRRRRRRDAEG